MEILLSFQTSIDTNLRYFQYRINHRILTTNRFLCIIKAVDQENCKFCNNTSESLVHLCVECDYVTDVWVLLHAWLVKNCHTQLKHFFIRILYVDWRVWTSLLICCSESQHQTYYVQWKIYCANKNKNMNKFYGKWASLVQSLHYEPNSGRP
jgi:hypothetical protein